MLNLTLVINSCLANIGYAATISVCFSQCFYLIVINNCIMKLKGCPIVNATARSSSDISTDYTIIQRRCADTNIFNTATIACRPIIANCTWIAQ